MKFAADRPFADPDKAAGQLVELANAVEADRDQRIAIPALQTQASRRNEGPMPALTRRRSTDARREGWHIYYGDD